MHNKIAQTKRAKNKKTSGGKTLKQGSFIFSETYNLEAKKRPTYIRKNLTAKKKLLLLPSLTICFDMEQIVLVPASVSKKNLIIW